MEHIQNVLKKTLCAAAALCMTAVPLTAMPAVTVDAATRIYGDADNNGVVDIGDVIYVSRFISGMVPAQNLNIKYADVDQNTVIDVNDAQIILSSLIGRVESLPYNETGRKWNYSPNSYSVPADEARSYTKRDCATGRQTTYTLPKASEISTMAENPFKYDASANAQCIVRLELDNGTHGSGFIVDDHIIATAAHCLYNGKSFVKTCNIEVYDVEGKTLIASYPASELHVPQQYMEMSSNSTPYDEYCCDYGLIYVEEDLSVYGKMAMGIATSHFFGTTQKVYVSGFPTSRNENVDIYPARYFSAGPVKKKSLSDNQFTYDAFAVSGDSGGPVYIEYTLNGSTFRSAVGIHTSGDSASIFGGTRNTLPLLRFYNDNPNIG